jgi:hypothetical protein
METINVPTRVAVHFKPEFLSRFLMSIAVHYPILPNRAETVGRLVEQALATKPNSNRKTRGQKAQRKNGSKNRD